MASSAARRAGRGAVRRPFAELTKGGASAENVAATTAHEGTPSFARRVRRFGKCVVVGGGRAGNKCGGGYGVSSPVSGSGKPVVTATTCRSRKRRVGSSLSVKCSTPAAKAKAKGGDELDPQPRAPAPLCWDVSSEEDRDGNVRANLSSSSSFDEVGKALAVRKRIMTRSEVFEEAMARLPEPGEGRVKYLVDTFERLLSLAGGPEARSGAITRRRKTTTGMNEATPTTERTSYSASSPTTPAALPPAAAAATAEEIDVSYPSSEVSFFPAIAGVSCILDASDRTSMIRDARERRRRQRRCNSTGTGWSSSQKTCNNGRVTTTVRSQRPFNLRTEQRGKAKEEDLVQRMREMQLEEETLRNPLAQAMPYTTDEPEYPVKPPTKEPTEPMDLVLHSDVRAVDRAKFDHHVAERTSFMEEVKLAKQRQQKMDEEVEIKLLRKEQVPRAHPMPDFTKPFVPKRSVKPHTIPREPRFHPRLMRNSLKAA